MIAPRYYALGAIRRSLVDLLFGKAVTAVCTLAVTLLLARALTTGEYAAYVAFVAIVNLIALLATAGIQQALARYLPELRQANRGREMYALLFSGLLLQTLVLFALTGGLIVTADGITGLFGLSEWGHLLPWYLAVGFVRNVTIALSVSLESLLWQRTAQLSLALGGLVKLGAILLFMARGGLDLATVVLIELAGDAVALVWVVGGLLWRWRSDPSRRADGTGWWRESRQRVAVYGTWAFLHGISRGGTGSPTLRLVAARLLSDQGVAVFGFADRIAELVRRFLPMRLFVGVVRPVINARFAATGDFAAIAALANLGVRINMVIVGGAVALLIAVGTPLFAWLTAGKYPEAGLLLALFCVLIMVESVQGALELLANAVEANRALFWSNSALVVALALAIPLTMKFGPAGLVVARMGGFLGSIAMVVVALGKRGYRYRFDWQRLLLVVAYVGLSGLLGAGIYEQTGSIIVAGTATVLVYGAASWLRVPLDRADLDLLIRLRRGRPEPAPAE